MPIEPAPKGPVVDPWTEATFYDVTLVRMVEAIISSGQYAPGPLIMQLAVAAAAQIMVQTKRWAGTPVAVMTMAQAQEVFERMGQRK